MRFTTHDSAADAAALRAARGVHDIVLEEGDCAPALGALAPYLALWTEGDEYKISFGAAADIALRYMRLTDPAAVLLKFHQRQCATRGRWGGSPPVPPRARQMLKSKQSAR